MSKRHKYKFQIARPEDKYRPDLVTIYKHPEDDIRYTLGLDAATGFGSDYTSIQVWSNRMPFEQVAWLRNKRITTVDGSEVMVSLARYYNNAFIVPEVRYPGNAYVDNAIHQKYAYGNIIKKTQTLDENPTVSSKFGISTTEEWKHLLINNFKELTERDSGPNIIFHDEITIYEFCNFVYIDDKRKTGGGEGFNDDTVIAAMLALYGCSLRPQKPREIEQQYDPRKEDRAHKDFLLKRHFDRLKGKKGILVEV